MSRKVLFHNCLLTLVAVLLVSGGSCLAGVELPARPGDPGPASTLLSGPFSVVQDFMMALQAKDWDKAADLFCTDFRQAHEDELRSGRLFTPPPGMSVVLILTDPHARVSGVRVRKDRAWVTVEVRGESMAAQAFQTIIELIDVSGLWRIVTFPPSATAYYESVADTSGSAVGKWFAYMLRDGSFSEDEQSQLKEVLDSYYAVRVQMRRGDAVSAGKGLSLYSQADIAALIECAKKISEIRKQQDTKLGDIVFWPKPSAETQAKSRVLAKQAINDLYDSIYEACHRFPELADFDKEHVRMNDDSLNYQPQKPAKGQKASAPWISLSIEEPNFKPTAMTFPKVTYLPNQRLAVHKHIYVNDKELEDFVNQCIDKSIKPLLEYEKSLHSSPVQENW